MSLRVLISGGGTGGHVYPALEVAHSLSALCEKRSAAKHTGFPSVECLFVGATGTVDRGIVEAAGIPFTSLNVGAVRGMNPLRMALNLGRVGAAVPHATAILRRFRPHVVLIVGGYVCVPMALAARLLGVPMVVMTVDIVPGWAMSLASRLATEITAAFPEALTHLPKRVKSGHRPLVVGYPVRPEFWTVNRAAARSMIEPRAANPAVGPLSDPLLVVFGGSQGARTINTALQGALDRLSPRLRILHIGGQRDAAVLAERRAALPAAIRQRYRLEPYLAGQEMTHALAAADLVVCRSGAGTVAELTALGVPAVVVPGPFSHQDCNAAYLVHHGAAVSLPNEELTAELLATTVLDMLDHPARLAAMAEQSRALAVGGAVEAIAGLVLRVADRSVADRTGERVAS